MKKIKKYLHAFINEADLSFCEFSEPQFNNDAINIRIKNGYWQINEKPLSNCSIVKKSFFDQYLRMKFVKSPIAEENTFKRKARETKRKFNHIFKHKEQDFLNSFPNLETLSFTPKN